MIVVTGGTGLVGAYLLLKLAEEKGPVRVLIRPESGPGKVLDVWKHYLSAPGEKLSRFEWHSVDHGNRAALYDALKGSEYIYHCAGKVSFDRRDKQALWEANVRLTERIVDYCLEYPVKKLVYVSSVAAVANPKEGIATENSGWPVRKKSLYSRTKTLGEFEIWRGVAEGLNAVVVNPTVIIGPGNWQKSSARLFSTIYKGLKYYTSGTTGFVDNRDVADALIRLMKSDISGERFILNAENISYMELFERIAIALRKKPPDRELNKMLSEIAWRGEWILSRITGREARLTKVTARTAFQKQNYSAAKIEDVMGFRFRDVRKAIEETAGCFLRDVRGRGS